jgi:hypothetical protein
MAMMSDVVSSSTVELLQHLHQTLDSHFAALRRGRVKLDQKPPVFALEHDLDASELELLKSTVRSAVAGGLRVGHTQWWLPFVVYAAESGYDYVGDEYWRSFEQSTPGWRNDQRYRIKAWFQKFAHEYGGAVPTGAFASTFTIIAWPITHGVLPIYLQRQLAQLLFEFSGALTSDLLDDPSALGKRLARRASTYSERFRIFCDNTDLVGQVAAALLSGKDSTTPYLLPSTLERIVNDLSEGQQARNWLKSAQQSAHRARGFKRSSGDAPIRESRTALRNVDPRLFLRLNTDWNAFAELPDLTPLGADFPEVYQLLRTSRGLVNGATAHVPPSGLLYPGQEVRLKSWPESGQPFLQLDRADVHPNRILADQCIVTVGPWWLFRRQGSGLAVEVKGKFVRPGHRYILIGRDHEIAPAVSWCTSVGVDIGGIRGYELQVPGQITEVDEAALKASNISVISSVAIRPVGVVASAWDGEGTAEWLAGEPAILGLRSDLQPTRCRLTIDGATFFLDWASDNSELLFSLEGLTVGEHQVHVSLLGDIDRQLAGGSLTVIIRDPQVRPESATSGEGIRLLAAPARPTLNELWNEDTLLTVDGPPGSDADLGIILRDGSGKDLVSLRRSVRLPVDASAWKAIAKTLRTDHQFVDRYDEAESCVLSVSREGVGFATLSSERGFRPLRWRFARSHDGRIIATLVDRTDGGNTIVELYEVDSPLIAISGLAGSPIDVPPRGGLVIARSGDSEASAILPTDPNALMRLPPVRPLVRTASRSPEELQHLAKSHARWLGADLPADAFAMHQQQLVGDAITRAISTSIAGRTWAQIEAKVASATDPADYLEAMQAAVGVSDVQKKLASTIAFSLYKWLTPSTLLLGFDEAIAPHLASCGIAGNPTAPRFLLMLAGRPGYISEWREAEAAALINSILLSPVLYRAARFAVLGTRILNDADGADRGF